MSIHVAIYRIPVGDPVGQMRALLPGVISIMIPEEEQKTGLLKMEHVLGTTNVDWPNASCITDSCGSERVVTVD